MPLLNHYWTKDIYELSVLCVKKSRGKINIKELAEYLRYESRIYSNWVILLHATEETCTVSWPEEESKGDTILLYEIVGEDACPVCSSMLLPEYCPHCGEKIKEDENQ